MDYSKNYAALKKLHTSSETNKEYDTIELHDLKFNSASFGILPGIEEYEDDIHNVTLEEELSYYSEQCTYQRYFCKREPELQLSNNETKGNRQS